ncbi:hypothetical protein DY245_27005 [Streptomyces inhibens]|uniref:Uncharacterized protein n=1 Tax=Streptomyces inhibens TaxID=2293571 RepID=A0A371PY44_STRIH|nr:hypothetical protein DY245_27005 [Streptomyces inhibens]
MPPDFRGVADGDGVDSFAVDWVNGCSPVEPVGSANTSAVAAPFGRVRTTVRSTATTMAPAMIATRHADCHQGPPSPAPPPPPPPRPPGPLGGPGGPGREGFGCRRHGLAPPCVGSYEGRPDGGPESGPVGGPVGWLSGGRGDVTSPSSGAR